MPESGKDQSSGTVIAREMEIVNAKGLHARASAKFVKCAEGFDAEIWVMREDQRVPGTSIMGLMMLAAAQGNRIRIEAKGPQAAEAVESLAELVSSGFDEES